MSALFKDESDSLKRNLKILSNLQKLNSKWIKCKCKTRNQTENIRGNLQILGLDKEILQEEESSTIT